MWRRYVEDELHNRDYPTAKRRTQRKPPPREEEGGGEGGAGGRRPRPPNLETGGYDKAYLREYLDPQDAKRQRRE